MNTNTNNKVTNKDRKLKKLLVRVTGKEKVPVSKLLVRKKLIAEDFFSEKVIGKSYW